VNPRTLISAGELAGLLGRPDVLVVDCRFELAEPRSGRRGYLAGHIPGAVYADLDEDLSDLSKSGLGRHPMPDAAHFSKVLGRLGWSPDMYVVAYDNANGMLAAARLWWMMRVVGHPDAAVLDGGLQPWRNAGLALATDVPQRKATDVSVDYDARQIVYTDELQRALGANAVLLDARNAPRFRGEVEPIDPVAGHVPGARNRPLADNLVVDGTFKSGDALRAEFETLLAGRDARSALHMCGSGVTACHNLLAMEHAGLTGSRVYAPSWSGWIADPSRPIARGEE
jgi:thiosulfate/3-mercaptopyruvate sulfurtransferase